MQKAIFNAPKHRAGSLPNPQPCKRLLSTAARKTTLDNHSAQYQLILERKLRNLNNYDLSLSNPGRDFRWASITNQSLSLLATCHSKIPWLCWETPPNHYPCIFWIATHNGPQRLLMAQCLGNNILSPENLNLGHTYTQGKHLSISPVLSLKTA